MNIENTIIGAYAHVYLETEEDIESVAKKLTRGLLIPSIEVNFSEQPPYEKIGTSEVLGFELWLQKSDEIENCSCQLEIQTEIVSIELESIEKYNMSSFFAKMISLTCNIKTHIK